MDLPLGHGRGSSYSVRSVTVSMGRRALLRGALLVVVGVGLGGAFLPTVVEGALPGRDGRIGYSYFDCGSTNCNYALATVSAGGGRLKERFGSGPAFSPRGRLLAFSQGDLYLQESGSRGLFARRGSLAGRGWRLTRGIDLQPDWSPGADRLRASPRNGGRLHL
jgi:hypothetical protein